MYSYDEITEHNGFQCWVCIGLIGIILNSLSAGKCNPLMGIGQCR